MFKRTIELGRLSKLIIRVVILERVKLAQHSKMIFTALVRFAKLSTLNLLTLELLRFLADLSAGFGGCAAAAAA